MDTGVRNARLSSTLTSMFGKGSVALADPTLAVWLEEAHSPSGTACEDALGVHWFPFPSWGDLVGRALVPPRWWSYRDLEELLAERGVEVDHVTLYRWVQRFTQLLIDAARPSRHVVGDRWFVDDIHVKISRARSYVYPAVDHHDQVIDVLRLQASRHRRRPLVHNRRAGCSWRTFGGVHGPGAGDGERDREADSRRMAQHWSV